MTTSFWSKCSINNGISFGSIPKSQSNQTTISPLVASMPMAKADARPLSLALWINLTFGWFNSSTTLQVPSSLSSTMIISKRSSPNEFATLWIASSIFSTSLYEGRTTETVGISIDVFRIRDVLASC